MKPQPTSAARTTSPRPNRGQLGTTLIELMMGLVVLMVVTTVAVPMVSSLLREQNLRGAAEDLVQAMDVARSRARSNRLAYGVVVDAGANGLKATVIRGDSTLCSSLTGANVTTVHSLDYSVSNPGLDAPVVVVRQAPADLANAGSFPCFKPDGRVLRADTSTPFSPPGGTSFMAGDVFFELQRLSNGVKIGNKLQVQLSYNGNARVTFGYDLGALQ